MVPRSNNAPARSHVLAEDDRAGGAHLMLYALVFVTALLLSSPVWAMSEWTYHRTPDGIHPDGNEQALMWLMNRARANPVREGRWLAGSADPAVAGGRNYFRVNRTKLRQEFARIRRAPPAAFDVRLYQAARIHALRLIHRDSQDHSGQLALVNRFGFNWARYRGNVFSYADSALNAHAAFNIDWGSTPDGMQTDRGHRKAIMNLDANYTNVGFSAIAERRLSTKVGGLVVVADHATAIADNITHYNRFIVGTVWRDLNNNLQYDPGEGVGGVTVTPDSGRYYAVTSSGGGYAIPIIGTVSKTITFSGSSAPYKTLAIPQLNTSVLRDYLIPTD